MLIKFLRSSFASQYVVLFLLAAILWLPSFLNPIPMHPPDGYSPLYTLIFNLLSQSLFISTLIAFSLVLLLAFFFNAILVSNQMIGRVASAGAFTFMLLMSLSAGQTGLTPVLIAMPFLLIALNTFFVMYDSTDNEFNIFRIALLISFASLIYFPLILLTVWVYISLLILRQTKLHEWIIPFIGFATPYIFLATLYYLMNVLIAQSVMYLELPKMVLQLMPIPKLHQLFLGIITIMMTVQAFFIVSNSPVDRNNALRKKKAIVNALMFMSIIIFVYKSPYEISFSMLAIPIAIYLSISYTVIRKYFWAQLFLLTLIVVSVLGHYIGFF